MKNLDAEGYQVSEIPVSSARASGLLTRLDGAWAWVDAWLQRWLPDEVNPLAQLGRASNFLLMVAVVTGVLMLLWYSPSVQFAYSSLDEIKGRSFGGIVRAVHRYSSDLVMLFLFGHALRVFVARKFSSERWLAWVSGITLIALIWFIGWTGYWLVWDKPAQQIAVTSMHFLDALPVFGEPLGRLFLADRLVPSLLFFVVFFLHMLLPLGIAIGLVVHLLRLSRAKLFPSWKLGVALTGGLLFASILLPAPLDEAARMNEKAEAFTVDAWYMTPLALGLRFQDAGLWLALGGTWVLSASVPWILGRRRKRDSYQASVDESRCHSCSQCSEDCPYDAITLVPRTDGKAFPSVASIDSSRCVGCGVCGGSCDSAGIGLPWFATLKEEERIQKEFLEALSTGGSEWVAFVAGDMEGGLDRYRVNVWKERLPEYQIFAVPTSSWIRSSLVELLIKKGAKGVLILRDARAEAAARDGNNWILDRLEQQRSPEFRPKRAGDGGVWLVLDYDPASIDTLMTKAKNFRSSKLATVTVARPLPMWRMIVSGIVLGAGLLAAAIAPSHLKVENPAPMAPEFVFSFKAFGDFVSSGELDETEQLNKPIHMRGHTTTKPHRSEVKVRLMIDGIEQERVFGAKGISDDGPAIGEWRMILEPGKHSLRVELDRGPESEVLIWESELNSENRRIEVLTYERGDGFRIE